MTPDDDNEVQSSQERGVTGFPEPPGKDPGDISGDEEPHHSLSNPVGEPDPTEWPDPYDHREDPKGPESPAGDPGRHSTSEPHPSQDIEAEPVEAPERGRARRLGRKRNSAR